MKVGDKVRALIKYGRMCSGGCGLILCPYYNHVGIIRDIGIHKIWVGNFTPRIEGHSNCSGFGVSNLELVDINWRKRIQSYAESKEGMRFHD